MPCRFKEPFVSMIAFGCSTLKGCVIFLPKISRRKFTMMVAFCGIFAPIFEQDRCDFNGLNNKHDHGGFRNWI